MTRVGSIFVPPRVIDRSINRPPRILLSSTMSSNVGEKHFALARGNRKSLGHVTSPKVGKGPVDRRPAVQTGVSGRRGLRKYVPRKFQATARCGCRWSVHATGSRDPRQFPFYGRAIYHLTARDPTRNSTSGITVLLFHSIVIAIGTHTRPCEDPRDATRSPWTVENRSWSHSFGRTARLRGR